MAYTHDFEIKINGIDVSGELNFNSGEEPKIKYFNSPSMSMDEWAAFTEMFKNVGKYYKKFGLIDRIEVTKK